MRIFPRQRSRAVTGMLAVATCALLLAGCAQPDPVVTPHATSTVKPLFASDADALAAATKAYAAYLQMSDLITADGGMQPERIASYVSKTQLNKELKGFALFREKKISTRGTSGYDSVTLQSNELLRDGNQEIAIYACSDASGVRVLNDQGLDVTPTNRPDRQPFELTFQTTKKSQQSLVLTRSELWDGADFC